jgi:hypothetical protein
MKLRSKVSALAVAALAALGVGLASVPAMAATCTTSAQFGQCSIPPYTVSNNIWGQVTGSSQTLTVDSKDSWGFDSSEPTTPAGIKAYPNISQNYNVSLGALSATGSVQQTMSYGVPPEAPGHWEVAADNWLDATAGQPGAIEVMVWTYNHGETPAGSDTGNVTLDGQSWQLWVKNGGGTDPTYTFLLNGSQLSGTVHFLNMMKELRLLGYITNSDVLKQLAYGVEVADDSGTQSWGFGGSTFTVHT